MPGDPFRLRVLKRITQVIKDGVHPDTPEPSSFDLRDKDLGSGVTQKHVFRGRDLYGHDDVLPLVSVLEDPGTMDALLGGREGGDSVASWPLIIQGFVQDDPENPTDPAHILVAEVVRAVVQQRRAYNHFGMGGDSPCITGFKISAPVVRPADGETSDVAWFAFRLTLELSEDLEKPFA